jgi:methyltransferase-like protein/ubiquinone/menaquinone biosynthesis C-methylase UbiE
VAAEAATTYDLLPYSSKPYALTHPDNLATVAGLAGLRAPALKDCRVLELGCGSGGNLVPMALSLPDVTFVGVDLSPRQVADAQELAAALHLTNIDFQPLNILAIGESLGRFDFIICHGVFSWVPFDVQEAILALCRLSLADNGVAFISYNAYPGWHLKGILREMLLHEVRPSDEPAAQVLQVRSLLQRLGRDLANRPDHYSRLLGDRVATAAASSDTYLFHEYLEDVNRPLYLHQFVERAGMHGLQYLGDAKLRTIAPLAADRVQREQYVDVVVNRSFRRSLLCREDVRLDPAVGAASLRACHAVARLRPVSAAPEVESDRVEAFRSPSGRLWSTGNQLDKALLVSLAGRYPATLSFAELTAAIERLLEADPGTHDLAGSLLRCWHAELIDLHARPRQLPERIADRPTASPLARMQAQTGFEVTNLRHHTVELDPVALAMLNLLDGTRDREALAAELGVLAQTEAPTNQGEGGPPSSQEPWQEDIDGSLERMLRYFQRIALLVS